MAGGNPRSRSVAGLSGVTQYPPPRPGPHGWLILDKPRGLGSTQGVGAVKRVLREAGFGKVKVGHGGTLDPLAEGVLPIALGEATKLAGRMLDSDKVYEFTVKFGEETDTLDTEGVVVATQRCAAHDGGTGGGAGPVHRADRAGAAEVFGAEGGWQARL